MSARKIDPAKLEEITLNLSCKLEECPELKKDESFMKRYNRFVRQYKHIKVQHFPRATYANEVDDNFYLHHSETIRHPSLPITSIATIRRYNDAGVI